MSLEETCLHRFVKDCKNCTKDIDTSHHPNNYDCRGYYPIRVIVHEFIEENYDFYRRDKI